MSNPFAQQVEESARARVIMGMFWFSGLSYSLQPWHGIPTDAPDKAVDKTPVSYAPRILHLEKNERSGADVWFSNLLNACREGNLSEDDYNFLHGFPTKKSIDFWYEHRLQHDDWARQHAAMNCSYSPYRITDYWECWPESMQLSFECSHCWRERKRRARALLLDTHSSIAQQRMADPAFAEAVLITPFNQGVY